jgi:hypothetical protein
MGHIRTFVEADIPQVATIHRTVFRTEDRIDTAWLDSYRAYFTRTFLDNPSRDDTFPSLVYEEDDENIVGFLGVVPRRMMMNGRRFQAAISSQFVVAPTRHAVLVALRLARAFLEGPQDLSISDEANDISRKIWEGLGGTTALLHSLYWTRPLRPARLALSMVRSRARLAPLALVARPLVPLVDTLATRMPHSHLYQPRPDVSAADDLTEQTILACLRKTAGSKSLRMEYDEQTLGWLLDRAKQRKSSGASRAAVIRKDERVIGWYFYHLDPKGIANVLQVAAEPSEIHDVLDHLFYQAGQEGAMAVTGRLDPHHLQALSEKYCVFHRRGPWVLLNSSQMELLRSFETGDACFSRLDGEWCLGF